MSFERILCGIVGNMPLGLTVLWGFSQQSYCSVVEFRTLQFVCMVVESALWHTRTSLALQIPSVLQKSDAPSPSI
jgi:hypothetical protein